MQQFFLFWEVNTAQPHYNAILSTFVLVKLQIQECSPNHFLYPELLSFCQNAKGEGPPWAGCQRCFWGLLKWLLARKEQLHPITDSKQMVTCGDENCDVIKPLICDFTLYFQSVQVMLPVWCSSLPSKTSLLLIWVCVPGSYPKTLLLPKSFTLLSSNPCARW